MARLVAAVLATLLVVFLVVVQPLRGRQRYLQLVAALEKSPAARLRFYLRGIASAWVAVGLVALIGVLSGRGPASIRLSLAHLQPSAPLLIAVYVGVAAGTLGGSLVVIWRGSPALLDRLRRQVAGFVEIIPRTRRERRAFAVVALTAGICEEILYRGFGIAYLRWLDPGADTALVVVVIGVAFGLAHLYQRTRGVLLTALIGAFFTWITLLTGTLLPAIVIHVLVDLRVVALPTAITEPPAT